MRTLQKIFFIVLILAFAGACSEAAEVNVADFDSGATPLQWKMPHRISLDPSFGSGTNSSEWPPTSYPYGVGGKVGESQWALASATAAFTSQLQRLPSPGNSLEISWNGVNEDGEFGGGVISDSVTVSDVSAFNALSFWVYMPAAPTKISVGLMTTGYISGYVQLPDYLSATANTWQNVLIPFGAMQRNNSQLDFARISEIKWLAEPNNGNDIDGHIYVDDVSMCHMQHAPAQSSVFSGGDTGIANSDDMPGDTLVWWDEAISTVTCNATAVQVLGRHSVSWLSVPGDRATLAQGTTVYFPYQLYNNGNMADKIVFSTATASAQGWPTRVYWDKDKSGTYTDGDLEHWDSIGLLPDSTHYFLAGVFIPFSAAAGSSTTVRVYARDNNGAGTNDFWPTGSDDDTLTDEFTLSFSSNAYFSIALLSHPADQLLEPGTTAYLSYAVRNNGNATDTFTLAVSTIAGSRWTPSLLLDDNGDGTHQASETTEIADTGVLASGDTYYFFIMVPVPSSDNGSATIRLTIKDRNGLGTNDSQPNAQDDDTVIDDVTISSYLDNTPPVITIVSEPPASIGMVGNALVFKARIVDTESAVTSRFVYQVNAGAAIEVRSFGAASSIYTTTVTVSESCSFTYAWYASNVWGASVQTSSRTITLSATTTAADFTSGTLTLVDGNPADGSTSISIPAGALTDAVALTVTQIQRDDASLQAAGAPADALLPSTVYSFGPDNLLFNKPVTITLLYLDVDGSGTEDYSGKDERAMRVFWWDGFEWRLVGGTVDPVNNTVTAKVMHFSTYAVFPIRSLSSGDYRPKERVITPSGSAGKNDFAQFPVSGNFTVTLYDINGYKVRTLSDGVNIWNGEDDNGDIVESGVYIYQIKSEGKTVSGTIVVAK